MTPEGALAWCRFAHDAAAMLLWGAFGFLAFLVPRDLGQAVGRRLAPLRVGGIAVAVGTTVLALPVEAAAVGDGWPDALAIPTIRAVLFDTSLGWAWAAQLAAALGLAVTAVLPAGLRTGAAALASGLLLAMLALQGHAAMQEGPVGLVHRTNDAVHVLAGGAWLGALVALLPILRTLDDPRHRQPARVALRRFSIAGHGAVALVIATGVANTALTLGRWPTDGSSAYQRLLAGKVAAIAAMTVLALVNRYGLVPRRGRRPEATLSALRGATLVEVGLGLSAIALVGVFGLLEPS